MIEDREIVDEQERVQSAAASCNILVSFRKITMVNSKIGFKRLADPSLPTIYGEYGDPSIARGKR